MTPSGATLILTVVATSCVAVLLGMPRPLEPTELPALVVTRSMEARARARDERLARSLTDSPELTRVRRLLDETARGETRREAFGTADARRRSMDAAVGALLQRRGAGPLDALRARATLDALDALDRTLPEAERTRRLGRFMDALVQYGAYRDGARFAPRGVVRVMFMARVNAMLGRLPTSGFSREEQRLFWGWLALHAEGAPIDLRMRALGNYGDLGGTNAAEAAGVMLYKVGEQRESARAFEVLFARNGSLRARDAALAGATP